MSIRRTLYVGAIAAGCASVPLSQAHAQLTFSLGAGATFPVSNLSKSYSTGYNILASLGIATTSPVNLRVDGMFNEGPHKSGEPGSSALQIWTLNTDVVYNITRKEGGITPYLLAGVGYYNTSYHISASGSTITAGGNTSANNFGINGGVGLRVGGPGLSGFVEGRIHYVFTAGNDLQFVPLTFGITF